VLWGHPGEHATDPPLRRHGRPIVFLSRSGRFKAKIEGPCSGNVLLRIAQYRAAANEQATREIARAIVAGKVQVSRLVLMRAVREGGQRREGTLAEAAAALAELFPRIQSATTLDQLRGYEGEAASLYFSVLGSMLQQDGFHFDHRHKRPPRDAVNALLSFLYTLVRVEVAAALETTGLDPQVGFLHALRPGRPALALDLLEELRSPLADRLAATLINRRQLRPDDFDVDPGSAVALTPQGRATVLAAYRTRKLEEVHHPLLNQRIPWALVPHAQARILARHLRGDLPIYLPFIAR